MSDFEFSKWEEIIDELITRNERFVEDKRDGKLQDSSRRSSLVGGQSPFAIILSCADSRVVPELIFDAGLGELFVVRVAGNVANTSSIASIEYAVAHLGVKAIVVMGHQGCGAVQAAIDGGDAGANLNHLLDHIQPSLERASGDDVDAVVRQNARDNAEALRERSAIITEAHASGSLGIVPAFYALETGRVEIL